MTIKGEQIRSGVLTNTHISVNAGIESSKILLTSALAATVNPQGGTLVGYGKALSYSAAPVTVKQALDSLFASVETPIMLLNSNAALPTGIPLSALSASLLIQGDSTQRTITIGSVSKIGATRDIVRIGSSSPDRNPGDETLDILLQSDTPLDSAVTSDALNELVSGGQTSLHTHASVATTNHNVEEYTATGATGDGVNFAVTGSGPYTWTFDLGQSGDPWGGNPIDEVLVCAVYVDGLRIKQADVDASGLTSSLIANRLIEVTMPAEPINGTHVIVDVSWKGILIS